MDHLILYTVLTVYNPNTAIAVIQTAYFGILTFIYLFKKQLLVALSRTTGKKNVQQM